MEFLQRHITKSESEDQTPNIMGTENANIIILYPQQSNSFYIINKELTNQRIFLLKTAFKEYSGCIISHCGFSSPEMSLQSEETFPCER